MSETPHPFPDEPDIPTIDILSRRAEFLASSFGVDPEFQIDREKRLYEYGVIFDAVVHGEISPREAASIAATTHAAADFQNSIDARTGLYNGPVVENRLKKALVNAARTHSPVSAAFIDLDDFGKINKEYSQEHGDAVLEHVGEYLRRYTRSSDLVGRLGGEELVVVMQGINESSMKTRLTPLFEEMPVYVENSLEAKGLSVAQKITSSVGVAQVLFDHPHPTSSVVDAAAISLIGLADRRMRLAKEAGKNRIVGTFDAPAIRRNIYNNGLRVQSRRVL